MLLIPLKHPATDSKQHQSLFLQPSIRHDPRGIHSSRCWAHLVLSHRSPFILLSKTLTSLKSSLRHYKPGWYNGRQYNLWRKNMAMPGRAVLLLGSHLLWSCLFTSFDRALVSSLEKYPRIEFIIGGAVISIWTNQSPFLSLPASGELRVSPWAGSTKVIWCFLQML